MATSTFRTPVIHRTESFRTPLGGSAEGPACLRSAELRSASRALHDPHRLSDFQPAAFDHLLLQATDGKPQRSTMRYVSPEELGANSPSFAGAFDSMTPYHADGVVERFPVDVEP